MKHFDILIVGAGIAGISAAKEAAGAGKTVFLADREKGFGGVLRQCSHKGFGSALTGPEYISELTENFPDRVELSFSTSVLELRKDKSAVLSSPDKGLFELSFSHAIIATGAMEISPGMLPIGGTRPQGVYTAGQAQLMNFHGESFPSPIVILGSGDLGLIMARQLYEQGHQISCIIEKNSSPTAMARNRGILENIPLITGSTVAEIHGEKMLEGISIENTAGGERRFVPCKTLLIAAGLRPDRSIARGFEDAPWLSFCGNCLKIYPMVEGIAADTQEAVKLLCERM